LAAIFEMAARSGGRPRHPGQGRRRRAMARARPPAAWRRGVAVRRTAIQAALFDTATAGCGGTAG